ncbi:HEPN domain-containing protein [Thermosulfurimonas sp. F29]|nr:HEPN domain-containing protein [Thermosulfurimonas sp. F29]MBX6423069.1 HEPN domain-containing protein [Thermosulfurimonas sp. F29]
MKRHGDWLTQALRDLRQAEISLGAGLFEWACFAAQQAAEKAVKALYEYLGGEGWGHTISNG